MVSGAVPVVSITSTSGTSHGGFHQWVPSTRSRVVTLAAIVPIGMTEVLLARSARRGASRSSSANSSCFSASFSGAASMTTSASPTAPAQRLLRRHARRRRRVLAEIGEILLDAPAEARERPGTAS